MSQVRGQVDEESDFDNAIEWLSKWYHVPSILLLVVFMFWTRARTWGSFIADGEVLFSGNDAWYHFYQVEYITNHWPETMPYDVWTNYPQGTSVSQFGTIFDQTVATIALVVGLGDPSQETIAMVLLFMPAVIGAALTIPTYYLGKRLGGKFAGVLAVVIIALASGSLLQRSMVGFSDHHVAEAFTQALAALTVVVALQVADAEKPVWELVVDRDFAALRRPAVYAALAGVGTALYLWTWPPGVLLLGVLGLYFTVQLSINYLRGESPEHVAFVGVVMFSVTAALSLIPIDGATISAVQFSLLQPGLALAGAVWCGFLAWVAREWDDRQYAAWSYPLVAVGVIAGAFVLLALVAPTVFDFLINNVQRVLVPGSTGNAAGTVGEVQPLPRPLDSFFSWFGLTMAVAAVGVVVALGRQVVSTKPRSELLFVSIWFVVMVLATLTQQRFAYYLPVPIAALTAYVVGMGIRYVQDAADDSGGIESYQVLTVLTVVMLVVVPMAATANVVSASSANGPGGITGWDGSLSWMDDNTPEEGTFAGADNRMDRMATVGKTDDYQYPSGSYGVLSWWDYGHWITAYGERIPVANPFQQSATEAAQFLLSQNETRANEVLGDLSDGENADTRYMMVDWRMATANSGWNSRTAWGKFFAPPAFVDGVSQSDYFRRVLAQATTQQGTGYTGRFFTIQTQDYYESTVTRLYRYHGSAAWPDDVPGSSLGRFVPVTVWDTTQNGTPIVQRGRNASTVYFNQTLSAAREFVNETNQLPNRHAQVGGLGKYPSEYVPALEQYRLVQASNETVNSLLGSQPGLLWFAQRQQYNTGVGLGVLQAFTEPYSSYTKVFEKVEGATIEGSVPDSYVEDNENPTVRARVQMRIPTTNQTFPYVQQAQVDDDGTFTMTVPYSTTGYSEFGPDNGYTNTSVRATGPYSFETAPEIVQENNDTSQVYYNGTASVTEGQVVGEDDSTATVELTRQEIPLNLTSGGNSLDAPDAPSIEAAPTQSSPDVQARSAE